ncbi:MAG: PIG-L deacetylase family protein [Kiritimatiellia bacterium]
MNSDTSRGLVVLAAAAHPDDIEFMMAGTLLLLKRAGAEIHMWNLANGHCGTAQHSREEIIRLRGAEAETSARLAGAVSHPPLFDDLGIFYDAASLARVAAVVREIRPVLVLTQSPQDYMEDHQNTCRLLVTAAFSHGMRNFTTQPPRPTWDAPLALYHALPHGLRDGLGQPVRPDLTVDIGSVLAEKRAMLACHRSQKEWLDVSQGMDAYLDEMANMSAAVGRMSGRCAYAEGWRCHSKLGFAPSDYNPLETMLKGTCHATTAE